MKKIFVLMLAIVLVIGSLALVLGGCNDQEEALRLSVPDGTPALSIASLIADGGVVGGKTLDINIVNASLIGGEVQSEKADIAILPTNAAAALYNAGAQYQLVTSNIFGVLYLIGAEDSEFTLDKLVGKVISSIGKNNTPQFVFERIIRDHFNNDDIILNDRPTAVEGKIVINYVANGAAAIQAVTDVKSADYAIVGEPAVTNAAKRSLSSLFDLQTGWGKATGKIGGYPQASLIVKKSVIESSPEFIEALIAALENGVTYLEDSSNREGLTELLKAKGSITAFPPKSIDNCNVMVKRAKDVKADIESYLGEFVPMPLAKRPDSGFYYGL